MIEVTGRAGRGTNDPEEPDGAVVKTTRDFCTAGGPDPTFWARLFGPEVRVAAMGVRERLDGLSPAERAVVASAVAKRQHQFSTGRWLARRVLAEMGYPDFALLRDADRLPRWPENVVGTISHKDTLCIVAIASTRDRLALGVDIEPDEAIAPGLERLVCRPRERDWLQSATGPSDRGRRCRAIFSAKEAVYKAFFPRLRQFWGFRDVEVEIRFDEDRFLAQLPDSADRREIEGRIFRRQGWILTAVEY